jgi:putative hydrolase of the HAD superfamily
MIEIIAFDADDTLWDNERLYVAAKQEFLDLLSECADPVYCAERLEQIESNNVRYYGYGIKSFVLSMIEAALELTERRVAADKIASVLGFAKHMLAADVQLIDGVAETLAALAPRYQLMLITKGDPSEQQRKIDDSGLANYFRWVEIVPDKTPAIYQAILRRYNISAGHFLMVGNSLRSDVLPVLQIGGQAVLVHYASNWAHEMQVDASGHEYATLQNLAELPGWLETGLGTI